MILGTEVMIVTWVTLVTIATLVTEPAIIGGVGVATVATSVCGKTNIKVITKSPKEWWETIRQK